MNLSELHGLAAGSQGLIFDRDCLARQTMGDEALQQEILGLFLDQLSRLESAEWNGLDLRFEMHTLRGAAAAVGAAQIEAVAGQWQQLEDEIESRLRHAFLDFRAEVTSLKH